MQKIYTTLLVKLNKLTARQAAYCIAVLGLAVYSLGLNNPFEGDDLRQIVNNIPVHSITNIKLFFEGGTFNNGVGVQPLIGAYYRPLMTTVFSLLYTLFGPHPFYFHLLQLLLCIGSAILLYKLFRYSFKAILALCLSLIFLVHPIDSQVVYAIPDMQDALFFFFGILGLNILLRYKSVRSLVLVAVCFLLSLLSKETGILFIAMALLYLYWYNRKRLYPFIGCVAPVLAIWLVLRVYAVGLFQPPNNVPIDGLGLIGRLLTAPSIVLLYLTKLVFPLKLSSSYYWVYSQFSFMHVVVPLIIDLLAIGIYCYAALFVRKHASKAVFRSFLFFSVWTAIGFLPLLQILPLDFTAFEPWFYFPMAGILGMIGVFVSVFPKGIRITVDRRVITTLVALIILLLGARSAIRGTDYKSQYVLAKHDIAASSDNYMAYSIVALGLAQQGSYPLAIADAQKSVSMYPTYDNYNTLGIVLSSAGDYAGSFKAYNKALKSGGIEVVYDNLSTLMLLYGPVNEDRHIFLEALNDYPQDPTLWFNLALWEDEHNDNADARVSIKIAASYGQVNPTIYDNIMTNQSFTLNLTGLKAAVKI